MARVGADETASGHRQAAYNLLINSVWQDSEADEANIEWARRAFAATRPYSTGTVHVSYINYEEPDRIEEAYGGDIHRQLVDLENRYDPENLLHHNQSIASSVGSAG